MKTVFRVVPPLSSKPDHRITRKGLLNPNFQYTRAAETDLRATFNRIRAEMAKGKS